MGQLCDLTRVACLNSIGKLLNADLIIQIWTDPKKNDVFRFIDISSAQEIHRQLISKDMTEDEIYIRIKNTYAQMFTSTDNSIATQRHSQPPLPPRPKTTLQESRQPSMQTFAGWSAVAVGGTATLMGSLFSLFIQTTMCRCQAMRHRRFKPR